MTSPVEELREAARVLRERAGAASSGPWEVGPTFGARDSRVYVRTEGAFDWVGSADAAEPQTVMACQVANVPWFRANAAYIATMDPLVGLALADLLESVESVYGKDFNTVAAQPGHPLGPQLLALSRRILGGGS